MEAYVSARSGKRSAAALLLRVDERIGLIRPDFDALAEWAAAL
ncbi:MULTISPECIES: hypothetical protein [Streptomyces]|nr:hypothetical protein [Streptomyces sp. CS081A]